MTLLAHISDLHLLERECHQRRGLSRQRLAFLQAGVPLDPERRIRQAVFAFQTALRLGAEHVLVTGDLTADGERAQFDVLAEVLQRSGIDPANVTLLPGNHDAYAERDAFARALEGPLHAYQQTSQPGAYTVLPAAVVVPLSTVVEGQWFTRSAGVIKTEDVLAVRRFASRPDLRDRAIVVAQHHPVHARALLPLEWLDGAQNGTLLRDLLLERTRVHVLHGHVRREQTRQLCGRGHAQVYGAAALRDNESVTGPGVLRLYKAESGKLQETVVAGPILQPLAAKPVLLPAAASYA